MVIIDGSQGEGGGQILRTSLALSAITGIPVTFEHIRANRAKPGLMRQHLTGVNAMAEICGAQTDGAHLRSSRLVFEPGEVRAGDYHFSIGTAGSTGLVFQTVLPALMIADAPSTVVVEGGTHNQQSPSFEFLERVFLPWLAKVGPQVSLTLDRRGFYPVGGGQITAAITPTPRAALERLVVPERGERVGQMVEAHVANLPWGIVQRELDAAQELLGWYEDELVGREVESAGPGNVMWVELEYEQARELFVSFGAKGRYAEQVAREAVKAARAFIASGATIGDHLADQLMLPLALAGGGTYTTCRPTMHTRTQAEIIEKFLEVEITLECLDRDLHLWSVTIES